MIGNNLEGIIVLRSYLSNSSELEEDEHITLLKLLDQSVTEILFNKIFLSMFQKIDRWQIEKPIDEEVSTMKVLRNKISEILIKNIDKSIQGNKFIKFIFNLTLLLSLQVSSFFI